MRPQRAIGLPPLALGQAPREPPGAREDRQPDPQRGQYEPQEQPAADHEQVDQPLAEADAEVDQRPPRHPHVRRDVERGSHAAASTDTSPVVLRAWIWNPPSWTSESPRMRLEPESDCASTW